MPAFSIDKIKQILDKKVVEYNHPKFIAADPISVPHQFTKKQDIEIAGFFSAILAWGNRTTIINNANKLMGLMDQSPHQFITQHQESDLKKMLGFVHRTFNAADLLFLIYFLQHHYHKHASLEAAFLNTNGSFTTMQHQLIQFKETVFALPHSLERTQKHIASPKKNSACKRLNMFLRWMVRQDNKGVDFGIWKNISPAQLICPLDVHVCNVANRLGLLPNLKSNWSNAIELTNQLKAMDNNDPVKYDFALFSLGVIEKYN